MKKTRQISGRWSPLQSGRWCHIRDLHCLFGTFIRSPGTTPKQPGLSLHEEACTQRGIGRQSVPPACTISHWTIVMIMVMNIMISVTWIAGCCIFMIHNHFNDHHPDHPLHRIKQTSLPASYAATVLSHTSSENSWALGQGAGMVIYDDDGVAEYFCIHHHHYQRPSLENVWHRCRCHTWRKLVPREQSPCRKWIFL